MTVEISQTFCQITCEQHKRIRLSIVFTLPSVTSPKEENASVRDFSSTDHDKPDKPKRHHHYKYI